MHHLLNDQTLTPSQLHSLNCCRMYLKVSCLSDIASTDGRYIQKCFQDGTAQNPHTTLKWPTQQKPQASAWKFWSKTIRRHFLKGSTLHPHQGNWLQITNTYKWYYSPHHHSVISHSPPQWKKYSTDVRRRYTTWSNSSQVIPPPHDLSPITDIIQISPTLYRSSSPVVHSPSLLPPLHCPRSSQPSPPPSSPGNRTPVLPSSLSTTRARLQLCDDIHIVCRGGLHDHFGYYGWLIASDTMILAKHHDLAPGNHEEMDQERANLAALLTSLTWLRTTLTSALLAATTILHIHITNNKVHKTLSNMLLQSSRQPNQMLHLHMELYLTILDNLDRLSLTPTLHNAASLPNQYTLPKRPSWDQTLLYHASCLAEKAFDTITPTTPFPSSITPSSGKAYLIIANEPITKNFHTAITRAWNTSDLRHYLTKKFRWDPLTCDKIDWYSFGSAMRRLSAGLHRWATKFLHEWLPLHTHQRIHTATDTCPVCNDRKETPHHFLHCAQNHPTANALLTTLESIGTTHNIDPWLTFILQHGIVHSTPVSPASLQRANPLFPLERYTALILSQRSIGWSSLHHGRFSLEWDRHQRRYLYTQGEDPSSFEPVWICSTILAILHHHHARWLQRNSLLHPTTTSNVAERNQLLMRITALYSHAPYLLQADQHCFNIPLPDWKTRSVYDMKRWLRTHTDHIRECRRQADCHTRQHTRDIRTYIPPTPHSRTQTCSTTPSNVTTKTSRTDFQPTLVSRQSTISKYFQPWPAPSNNTSDPAPPYPSPPQPPTSTKTHPQLSSSSVRPLPHDQSTSHRITVQTAITKYFK